MKGKSSLYVPLDIKEIVVAGFSTSHSSSIHYRRYKSIEGVQKAVGQVIQGGADYISIRIVKEAQPSP
jgi:hypothetical protein